MSDLGEQITTVKEVTFTEEEKKAKVHLWECVENNIPFEYKFSEEYLTYFNTKLQNRGWKIVDEDNDKTT